MQTRIILKITLYRNTLMEMDIKDFAIRSLVIDMIMLMHKCTIKTLSGGAPMFKNIKEIGRIEN